ncbi:MAG: T9SS type A sorting domain-containing protein [Saprospiraceae bacterium]
MNFSADLPTGYEVAELYYTYPSAAVSSCNNGTCAGGNDISSLISDLIGPNGINLGAANILPDNGSISAAGELPGVQSGANDAARRINFCVGVRATCMAVMQTGDLVFHASGRRPCGSVIEVENNQFTDPLDDWYVAGIDAEISINAPVKLDCKLGTGNVQITINWPAGLVVPPYQTFHLQIFSNLNIPGIVPVTYVPGNNPQTILIPFQYDPELPCDTRGIVSANLMTEATLPCGNTECQVSYSIDSDFASFELNNGRIEVSSLEISDELCPQIEPDFGTITFQLTNNTATGGMPATVQYFCDANQDGIPDGSAFALLNINLPPTGTSTTVTLNIQESVFWAGCPSGNIVALLSFPHAKCICVEGTLTASDCCECPEFEIDFVNLGGNAYEFTLTPSDYITWIFEWSYPGGSQFVNATTNPFVIDFDDYGGYVPDEICSRIESLMEDCDSTKTAKSIVTDPPCSQKICFKLDECYAKASFTYTIVDQTWGSADVLLDGTVATNMNPYYIYWYVNGVQVGTGSPQLVTLPTGTHEICMVVAGIYNGVKCDFKECKIIEIKNDCKDLDPNFTYSAEGPNDFGYLFEANAVLSDPNAYHYWYLALSDESCKIVQPIGIIEGESMSTYLEECQYYVIVHRVKTDNCEACYARCIFICDGRSSGRDEELGNFDCKDLDKYEWKTIGFDGNGPDFSKSEGSKLLDEEILISPNPVSANARISWSLRDVDEMVISDFTGNRVAYHKLNGEQSFELSTTDMHQGIYFVRIKNIHGDYLVKRFEVIRH